jgi:ATP-dependent RNA helicase DDX35
LIRAHEIRRNLRRLLLSFAPEGGVISSSVEDSVAIRKCIVSGFFGNVAKLGPHGKYVTARGGKAVTVHSTSVLSKFGAPPEWVVFHDVVHTSSAHIRDVTKIEPLWLLELAGKYYTCGLSATKK